MTRVAHAALATPGWRRRFGVVDGNDRQLQEKGLRDLVLLAVEVERRHVHRLVRLRIGVLVDRAENEAVDDRLANVRRIVTDDELHLLATILVREAGGSGALWPLHDDQ